MSLLPLALVLATSLATAQETVPRSVHIPGSEVVFETWEAGGMPMYRALGPAVTGVTGVTRERRTSYDLILKWGRFDPLTEAPRFEGSPLQVDREASGELHVVQFHVPPLEAFRSSIRALGGEVRHYLPQHAHLVRMAAPVRERVLELPFVRAVVPYHPEFRLEPLLLEGLRAGSLVEEGPYNVQVIERGPKQKEAVAARIELLGGEVLAAIPEGFLLEARLTPELLALVVGWDEVLWVDRSLASGTDMDQVRVDGGADFIEATLGLTGQGVVGEVMDNNLFTDHPDLQTPPLVVHGTQSGFQDHGTRVTGIVFGDGATSAAARGLLPDGQGFFADFELVSNRYTHTAELMAPPYETVFQTNSWGTGHVEDYNSVSMQMDDILFQNDLVVLQSQGNQGTQESRGQAWAKNIVSVGGIRHFDNLDPLDDGWMDSASIGPAEDGRIKPDLCYWNHFVFTTTAPTGHANFSGTSASTAIVAGYFGLFFQMWHTGVFGNAPGASVFESKPHATTARALIINTASSYTFSGGNVDLTRTHQGWGRADIEKLYELRDRLFIIDETDLVTELESKSYELAVDENTPELRATLVYLEPAGTTSSGQHRINDLSLRLTAPSGISYWGNVGLGTGNLSTPGGFSDVRNPVENVFLEDPEAGVWLVEVIGDEVIADNHLETAELDVDFALVVSGTTGLACPEPSVFCTSLPNSDGVLGELGIVGSTSMADNDLTLVTANVPPKQPGIFYYGPNEANEPFGDGIRCVAGPFTRLSIVKTDLTGVALSEVDLSAPPGPAGPIVVGSVFHFQFWHRDPMGAGGSSFNLTNGLRLTFCD